jgi:hypothetical protein
MTPSEFRSLALDLPEAEESAHQGHPDFRVGGRVFASLGPDGTWGMLKPTCEQQVQLVGAEPEVFEPFAGAWGARGATRVAFARARKATVEDALAAAWRNTAPRAVLRRFDAKGE